jgi:hypothetical protein
MAGMAWRKNLRVENEGRWAAPRRGGRCYKGDWCRLGFIPNRPHALYSQHQFLFHTDAEIKAERKEAVLPRYGLYSTYTTIFATFLLIWPFLRKILRKSRNYSQEAMLHYLKPARIREKL